MITTVVVQAFWYLVYMFAGSSVRSPILLSWSKIWQEVVKNEMKLRLGDVDSYFIGGHNRKFSIVSPEER